MYSEEFTNQTYRKTKVEGLLSHLWCSIWACERIGTTVDGQIIQTPHPWVVGYPLSPQISTLWFRIFVPHLRVWFISSIRRSEPNQKNNIVIGGCGGLLDYKGLNNSSIYGSYPQTIATLRGKAWWSTTAFRWWYPGTLNLDKPIWERLEMSYTHKIAL